LYLIRAFDLIAWRTTVVNDRTALVLGATGGIGGELSQLMVARGWKVRALNRDPDRLPALRKGSGLIWKRGDAMVASDVAAAADNASIIIHAVELRYLWNVPIRMDNERLKALLGAEPHTPLDLAVRNTLIGLGCLAS
jgi:uncharacterized protein YbjT (DUF2867 family)